MSDQEGSVVQIAHVFTRKTYVASACLLATAVITVALSAPIAEAGRICPQQVLRVPNAPIAFAAFGGNPSQLTNNAFRDDDAALSPDGRRVAFFSWRDDARNGELYLMNASGRVAAQRITSNAVAERSPSWSTDGRKIAYAAEVDGDMEIHIVEATWPENGNRRVEVFRSPGFDDSPSWSPDGSSLVIESTRFNGALEIVKINLQDGGVQRLTHNNRFDAQPSWSPDGRSIAFVSQRENDGNDYEIYKMDANGDNQMPLTRNDTQNYDPSWSPGSNNLVYTTVLRDGWSSNLQIVNTGTRHVQTFDYKKYDGAPDWSPDGRRIIFSSNSDNEDSELFQIDAPHVVNLPTANGGMIGCANLP